MYKADDEGDFDPTVMIGLQLGRYRTGRQLGSGSMADVFEATDIETGDVLALKVLNARSSAVSEVVARFIREGRALQKMNHPNIVRVHDHGVTPSGDAWIAMERLDGLSLDVLLKKRGRLRIDHALRIAKDVAAALSVVHERGMLHRDVKPENIFVTRVDTPEERSKLIDFGVAHVAAEDFGPDSISYTRAGSLLGSLAFMAPEQLGGRTAVPASDVFSLAVTLYEMLSGELPFEGASLAEQVLRSRVEGKCVPLRKRLKDRSFPAALDALLARALSPDPAMRPANGGAFGKELGAISAPPTRESLPSAPHGLPSGAHALPSGAHALPSGAHALPSGAHALPSGAHGVASGSNGISTRPAASVRPHASSRPHFAVGEEAASLRGGAVAGVGAVSAASVAPAASPQPRSHGLAIAVALVVLVVIGLVAALMLRAWA